MKKPGSVFAVLLLAAVLLFMPCPGAYAATDGYYNVSQTTSTWDGTDASRFEAATSAATDRTSASSAGRRPRTMAAPRGSMAPSSTSVR